MKYKHIWSKTLNSGEVVEYEFSIGEKYLKFNMIICGIICLPFTFLWGLGLVVFALIFAYLKFYVPRANAYAFTNKKVLVHRGWLSTDTISVDYAKITDVRVVEPFFDRLITKTGHLVINTAGGKESEIILIHIPNPYEAKKKLDELKDAVIK